MVELNGTRGQTWLTHLPQLITQCAQRWELLVGPPFPLSYNYVAPTAGIFSLSPRSHPLAIMGHSMIQG